MTYFIKDEKKLVEQNDLTLFLNHNTINLSDISHKTTAEIYLHHISTEILLPEVYVFTMKIVSFIYTDLQIELTTTYDDIIT